MFLNLTKEDKTLFLLFWDLGTETVPLQNLLDGLENSLATIMVNSKF